MIIKLSNDIEKIFCQCHADYKKIGRIDPACQAHDIADFVSDVSDALEDLLKRAMERENELTRRVIRAQSEIRRLEDELAARSQSEVTK